MKHFDVTAMVNENTAPRAAARHAKEARRDIARLARLILGCTVLAVGFPLLHMAGLVHENLSTPAALIGIICLAFTLGAFFQHLMPERGIFHGRR
jgi:hypothetical protein